MTAARSSYSDRIQRDAASREAILALIRESLSTSARLNDAHAKHDIGHFEKVLLPQPPVSSEELIASFTTNLASVGGHYSVVTSEIEAADVVRDTVKALGAGKIAISDSPLVESVVKNLTSVEIVGNADREYLFASEAGITSAQWAIAETGTLVLDSKNERHRLTSLVPPVHICILRASLIRQTLGEVLDLVHDDLSRVVTFITGASRTSDIELTLAIGVHGPRELHVVVIIDQP